MTKPKQMKRLRATMIYIKREVLQELQAIQEEGETMSHLLHRLVMEHKNRRLKA